MRLVVLWGFAIAVLFALLVAMQVRGCWDRYTVVAAGSESSRVYSVLLPLFRDRPTTMVMAESSNYVEYWAKITVQEGPDVAEREFYRAFEALEQSRARTLNSEPNDVRLFFASLDERFYLTDVGGSPPKWWIDGKMKCRVARYRKGIGTESVIWPTGEDDLFIVVVGER
jgi:hypothetical protein